MTLMVDLTHASIPNLPRNYQPPKVGGYITGTPGIQWTPADWARFPESGHDRIDQRGIPALEAPEIDCEFGAATPQETADCMAARLRNGHARAGFYASRNKVAPISDAVHARGLPFS